MNKGLLIQFGIDLKLSYNILSELYDIDRLVIEGTFNWTKVLATTEVFEGIKQFNYDKKPFSSYHRMFPLFMIMYKNLQRNKDILFNLPAEIEELGIDLFEYDIPRILEVRDYVEDKLSEKDIEQYDYIGLYTLTRTTLHTTISMMLLRQRYPDKKIIGGGSWFETERNVSDMLIDKGILDAYLVGDAEGLKDLGILKGRVVNYCKRSDFVLPPPTVQSVPWNNQEALFFYVSKGCPLKCSFCQQGVDPFRTMSADQVALYLKRCVDETGVKLLFASDNTFFVSNKWLFEFRDAMERVGLLGEVEFELCNIHPKNLMNERVLDIIKELNIHPFIGVESFSTPSLKKMNKETTREENLKMVEDLRKKDINFTMGRIFQFPGETEAEFQESMETYLNIFTWNPNSRYLGVFSLFPNTPVFNNPEQYGIEFRYFSKSVYDYMPEFKQYLDKLPCRYIDKTDPDGMRFNDLNKRIRLVNDTICKMFPL